MRVLVVGGDAATRLQLTSLLRTWGIEVVGEAADEREALAFARRLRPDAILIDAAMLVRDAADAARLMEAELPDTRIVIVDAPFGAAAALESAWLEGGAPAAPDVSDGKRMPRARKTANPSTKPSLPGLL